MESIMDSAVHAFVLTGNKDWRLSSPDDWELDIVELDGSETVIGHHRIDGSTFKIIKNSSGKLLAISK